MNNFIFELIGTAFLILLGNGVVANVALQKTNGNNGGWIVIYIWLVYCCFCGCLYCCCHTAAHI